MDKVNRNHSPFHQCCQVEQPIRTAGTILSKNKDHRLVGKKSRHHFYSRERERKARESVISYRQQKNEV